MLKKQSPREKGIEKAIIEYIFRIGGWAVKVQSGKMKKDYLIRKGGWAGKIKTHWIQLAPKGTPDILALIDGLFVAVEVKSSMTEVKKWYKQNDSRSICQKKQLDKIKEAGGFALLVCSLDEFIHDIESMSIHKTGLNYDGEKQLKKMSRVRKKL